MVVINKNLTPPKFIKNEICLQAKGLSRLSKDFGPKRHPKTWKEESKEIKDSMKVVNEGVHHKKYHGHCMKQCVQIPKAT